MSIYVLYVYSVIYFFKDFFFLPLPTQNQFWLPWGATLPPLRMHATDPLLPLIFKSWLLGQFQMRKDMFNVQE